MKAKILCDDKNFGFLYFLMKMLTKGGRPFGRPSENIGLDKF